MSKLVQKNKSYFLLFLLIGAIILFTIMAILSSTSSRLGQSGAQSNTVLFAVVAGVLFIFTFYLYVIIYNKFIRYKNKLEESLSLIDVHLKLRFDLVPNLVACVKGYMQHEKQVLTKIVSLRNAAISSKNEESRIGLANDLVSEMGRVLFLAEDYPDLKSSTLFSSFMNDLEAVENKIAASRRFYNSNTNAFNTLAQSFPSIIIARQFGFEKQKMFQIDVNEKLAPNVNII